MRGEEEDGGEGRECGQYIDGTGSGRAHDNIKKRRGPRERWWRWITAFSLLLSALLAAIAVMFIAVAGNANGDRGEGIDAASGQIESALSEGGAGRSKGGGDGDNNDAHSNDAVGSGNVGLHVAVDPHWAETGDGGGGGRTTMTTTAGGTVSC